MSYIMLNKEKAGTFVKWVRFLPVLIVMLLPLAFAQDVLVWQGQYFIGTEFQTGSHTFNFTVYDDATSGQPCYSNVSSLTTGSFGEWKTEQYGVGASCNNVSKSYFVEVIVDGDRQTPRRRLMMFSFLRRDAPEIVTQPMTYAAPIMSTAGLNISTSTIEHTINQSGFMRFIERNLDGGPDTVIIHTLENNAAYQFSMALTSSTYNFTGPNKTNEGLLSLNSPGEMSFLNRYSNRFNWRVNPANDGNLTNQLTIMRLEPQGNLFLDYGGLTTNKSIASGENITAAYFIGDGSRLTGITAAGANDTVWNITNSNYLINSSGVLAVNETRLNSTITAQAAQYNDTTLIKSINASLTAQLAGINTSSSSFNATYQTYAYNQTSVANAYTDAALTANNASWLSTYNATYAANMANNSWNQTLANTLYANIQWNYNQTAPAMSYADARFLNLSGGNANQNINIGTYNFTSSNGFFSYLGSISNRISKLFVQDVEASNNVSANLYRAANKTGITSTSFSVCDTEGLAGTCADWCTLEITGGIITGCT